MPRYGQKISQKASSASKKPPLTHFLCVPLVNPGSRPQLETSIQKFKGDVCRAPDDSSKPAPIADKAVRPVGAIHLTLGVMSLNPEQLAEATQALKQTNTADLLREARTASLQQANPNPSPSISQPNSDTPTEPTISSPTRPVSPPLRPDSLTPITISLKSLTSMHPPTKTSILYTAPHDPSNRLHALCSILRTRFQAAGFLVEDTRPLKLHATIVNTIYAKGRKPRARKPQQHDQQPLDSARSGAGEKAAEGEEDDRSRGHGPDAKAPLRMDATEVLERYTEYVWAENVVLDRIAICEMGAKKVLDGNGEVVSEEYREVAVLDLSTSA